MVAPKEYPDTLRKLWLVQQGERDPVYVRVATGDAMREIEELRAIVRKRVPEIEARKALSFATAEAIFSEPRRDQ